MTNSAPNTVGGISHAARCPVPFPLSLEGRLSRKRFARPKYGLSRCGTVWYVVVSMPLAGMSYIMTVDMALDSVVRSVSGIWVFRVALSGMDWVRLLGIERRKM